MSEKYLEDDKSFSLISDNISRDSYNQLNEFDSQDNRRKFSAALYQPNFKNSIKSIKVKKLPPIVQRSLSPQPNSQEILKQTIKIISENVDDLVSDRVQIQNEAKKIMFRKYSPILQRNKQITLTSIRDKKNQKKLCPGNIEKIKFRSLIKKDRIIEEPNKNFYRVTGLDKWKQDVNLIIQEQINRQMKQVISSQQFNSLEKLKKLNLQHPQNTTQKP